MNEPKSPAAKEVWITGIGIVSSLGEGLDAHWEALNAKRVNIDEARFAPYVVHPLAPVSFDAQIAKNKHLSHRIIFCDNSARYDANWRAEVDFVFV